MGLANGCSFNSHLFSNNAKVLALDSTLQQFVVNFKELLSDYEHLQIECEAAKQELSKLKNKCDCGTRNAIEELKKVIATKNEILLSVASTLTKLNDTKDWNVLAEIFKILFEDTSSPEKKSVNKITITHKAPGINSVRGQPETSPKSEIIGNVKKEKFKTENVNGETSITEDVSFKEESLCEIEGTPGRTSPILHVKKTKSILGKSSDFRDKKKCSEDWPSSESKSIKLTYRMPRSKPARLKQSRLKVVPLRQTSVVDLTCSPEFSGGKRNAESALPLIKKESIENDDTILPSPTSGPTSFTKLKTTSKDSPNKFKRPALSLKTKTEKCENEPKLDENRNVEKDITNADLEYSINILNPLASRFNDVKKEKPVVMYEGAEHTPPKEVAMDEDATHCESISLLDHVKNLERDHNGSPAKRPLGENINIMNTPPKDASSASTLQPDKNITAVENAKRKIPELVEPIYKEPTVRNKQEKRNLQGWSCEQCKNFYGELYKNDPVMLARKINECSKHRGRHNPERPKTPPNFWNPRWHVPTDTEELNRMNNAN